MSLLEELADLEDEIGGLLIAPGAELAKLPSPFQFAEGESINFYIEKAINQTPQLMTSWLKPVEDLLEEAGSFEEFREQLFNLYPALSHQDFTTLMGKALVAVEAAGRFEVIQETETAEEFADSAASPQAIGTKINLPEDLLELRKLLEVRYTDGITAIPEASTDGDNITGIFEDKVSEQLTKRYQFTITQNDVSYGLVNGEDVELAEIEIDFAAGKTKNCTKGTPCKGTCIAKNRQCRDKLGDAEKPSVQKITKAKSKTATSQPPVQPATQPPVQPATNTARSQKAKNYQEQIDNGKVVAAEYLKQTKGHFKKWDKLEDAQIDYDLDLSRAALLHTHKLAGTEPAYQAAKQEIAKLRAAQKPFHDDFVAGKITQQEYSQQVKPIMDGLSVQQKKMQQIANDFEDKARAEIENSPAFQQRKAKLDKEREALEKPYKDFMDKLKRNSIISDDEADQMIAKLEIDKNVKAKHPNIEQDLKEYIKLTNGQGFENVAAIESWDIDRSSTNEYSRKILLGRYADKESLMHELAHHIEFADSDIGEHSQAFIESRATGKPKKLNVLDKNGGFNDDEIAYPDKFIDPYVGKKYQRDDDEKIVTEVVTTGFERFHSAKDMAELAAKDPQHFAYVLGVIRGGKE
jgi:hypothetical protein